ncbi:MAG: hypothetical protein Q9163_000287 [Psora crenata]
MRVHALLSALALALLPLSTFAIPSLWKTPHEIVRRQQQQQQQEAPQTSAVATTDRECSANGNDLADKERQKLYSISDGRIPGAEPVIAWQNRTDGAKNDQEYIFKYGPVKANGTLNPHTLALSETVYIFNCDMGTYPGSIPYGFCIFVNVPGFAEGTICLDIRRGLEVWIVVDLYVYLGYGVKRHIDVSFYLGRLLVETHDPFKGGVPDQLLTAEGPPTTVRATATMPYPVAPAIPTLTAMAVPGGKPSQFANPSPGTPCRRRCLKGSIEP